MKTVTKLMIIMAALVMMAGCKKGDKIAISGYTATDDQGHVVANDADDWRFNASVPTSIMSTLNGFPIQDSRIYTASFCGDILVFPNPNNGAFSFGVHNSCAQTYTFKYIIVDQNLHSYASNVVNSASGSIIATINLSSLDAGLYRMYYAVYGGDNKPVAQGYGDIQKQ